MIINGMEVTVANGTFTCETSACAQSATVHAGGHAYCPFHASETLDAEVYAINTEDMPAFGAKAKGLQRRAAKLNLGTLVYHVLGETLRTSLDGTEVYAQTLVVIPHQPVVLDGYEFVASIQHTSEGNVIACAPGQTLGAEDHYFRTTPPICQHCKTNRARRDTYIVRDADGYSYQVGSTCLRDFVGNASAASAANFMTLASQLDDAAESYSGAPGHASRNHLVLDTYVALCAYYIREDGWVSRTKAREDDRLRPTANKAMDAYYGHTGTPRVVPTDADTETAASALRWAHTLGTPDATPHAHADSDALPEYLHNLKVVCAGEAIELRHAGLAASVITAHHRAIRDAEPATPKGDQAAKCHIGKVGDKVTITATIKRIIQVDGAYGTTNIHIMEDEQGNDLVWFASGCGAITLEPAVSDENGYRGGTYADEGWTGQITGTVKDHNVRNGQPQTILTRCKLATAPKIKATRRAK